MGFKFSFKYFNTNSNSRKVKSSVLTSVQYSKRGSISCRGIISKLPVNAASLDLRAVYAIFHNLQNENSVTEEDIQHPKFQTLLKRTESLIPQMAAAELSNIATGIMNHAILIQHEINNKIQDALMLKINELSFERILFLDYVIFESKSSGSFKTIRLKVQEMFLEKVTRFFTDHSNNIQTFDKIA